MSILNETGATDLGLNSVKDNDELGVLRSIDFLTERGTEYIRKRLEPDAKKAVISIRNIGSAAVLQKMEIGVFLSLFSLGKMAEAAREKKMYDTGFSILHSLCAIGKAAVGQKMETAVRIAVAYLEEIINTASFQKMEREALAAALAIGSIGKETLRQQNIRVSENGGLLVPVSSIFSSPIQDNGAAIFSKEYPFILSLLVQQGREIDFLQHMPTMLEQEFSSTDLSNFEDVLSKASFSLGTIILQNKDRSLLSYVIMTKLSLETFNGSEYINEAESLD
jgi:hypothetical protein